MTMKILLDLRISDNFLVECNYLNYFVLNSMRSFICVMRDCTRIVVCCLRFCGSYLIAIINEIDIFHHSSSPLHSC